MGRPKLHFSSENNTLVPCSKVIYVPELAKTIIFCESFLETVGVQCSPSFSGTVQMVADKSIGVKSPSFSVFLGSDQQLQNVKYSVLMTSPNSTDIVTLFIYEQRITVINCSLSIDASSVSQVVNAGIFGRSSGDVSIQNSNLTVAAVVDNISSGVLICSGSTNVSIQNVILTHYLNATARKSIMSSIIGELNSSQQLSMISIHNLDIQGSLWLKCNIYGMVTAITNTNLNITLSNVSTVNLQIHKNYCENCSNPCCDFLIYVIPHQFKNLTSLIYTLEVSDCRLFANDKPLLNLVKLVNGTSALCPAGSTYVNSSFCQCSQNLLWDNNTDRCQCSLTQFYINLQCQQCGQNAINLNQGLNSSTCICQFGGTWVSGAYGLGNQSNGCFCNQTQYNSSGVCTYCGVAAEQTGYISTSVANSLNQTCSCYSNGQWQTIVLPFCPCNSTQYVLIHVCTDCGANSINKNVSSCQCIGTGSWLNNSCTPCNQQQFYFNHSCLSCPQGYSVLLNDPTTCNCPIQFVWTGQSCGCSLTQYLNSSLRICFTCGPNAVQSTTNTSCSCSIGGVWQPTYSQSNNNCSCLQNQYLNVSFGCLPCGLFASSMGGRVASCSCQGNLGFWNPTAGYENCTPCSTLQFFSNSTCYPCPSNQVSNLHNFSQCTCPTNYQWDSAQNKCTCDANFYYLPNATCIACPSGILNTGIGTGFTSSSCQCYGNSTWQYSQCGCSIYQYFQNGQCLDCGGYAQSGGFYNTSCACANTTNLWADANTNTVNFSIQCLCTSSQFLKILTCTYCGSHAFSIGNLNESCQCSNTSYFWRVWINGSTTNNCPCLQTEFLGLYLLCDQCGSSATVNSSGNGCACSSSSNWNYSMTYTGTTDASNNCGCNCRINNCIMAQLTNINVTGSMMSDQANNLLFAVEWSSGNLNNTNITITQDQIIASQYTSDTFFSMFFGYSQVNNVEITIINNIQWNYSQIGFLDNGWQLKSAKCICINFTYCNLSSRSSLSFVAPQVHQNQTIENCLFFVNCSSDSLGSIYFVDMEGFNQYYVATVSIENITIEGTVCAGPNSSLLIGNCSVQQLNITNSQINVQTISMTGNSSFLFNEVNTTQVKISNMQLLIGQQNSTSACIFDIDENSVFGCWCNSGYQITIKDSTIEMFVTLAPSTTASSYSAGLIACSGTDGTICILNSLVSGYVNATGSIQVTNTGFVGNIDCINLNNSNISVNQSSPDSETVGFIASLSNTDDTSFIDNCSINYQYYCLNSSMVRDIGFIAFVDSISILVNNNTLNGRMYNNNTQSASNIGIFGTFNPDGGNLTHNLIILYTNDSVNYNAGVTGSTQSFSVNPVVLMLNNISMFLGTNSYVGVLCYASVSACLLSQTNITGSIYSWGSTSNIIGILSGYAMIVGNVSYIKMNVSVYQNTTGNATFGGIAAGLMSYSSILYNCSLFLNATFNGSLCFGGLIGGIVQDQLLTIANCSVNINCTTNATTVLGGALLGFVYDNSSFGISNCTANVSISGPGSSAFGSIMCSPQYYNATALLTMNAVFVVSNVTITNITVNVSGGSGMCIKYNGSDAIISNITGCCGGWCY